MQAPNISLQRPFSATDAAAAYEAAKSLEGEIALSELPKVYAAIKKAAGRGERMCALPSVSQENIVRGQLGQLGYELKYHEGDYRDQRESSYYSIHW